MRILITAPYNEKGIEELENYFGEVVYHSWKSNGRAFHEDELIDLLKDTNAEALVTEHDEVSAKVIDTFPDLKFIGVCRGTPSNVSLETAGKYNIPVFNTPARNAQAVAEMFVSNVIFLLRNTYNGIKWLEAENWNKGSHTSYLQFKGNELAGKTVGMIGFGAVGQRIAGLIRNFPCKVQYYDPFLKTGFPEYTGMDLEKVFETSDIISINLPANKNTKGIIDKRLLSLMKRDAVFVNMSRAMVVNREDLLDTLKNRRIRGAILDVFDHEPPDSMDYELVHLPNVLATPHIAGATHEVEDHHVIILNGALFKYFAETEHLNQKS